MINHGGWEISLLDAVAQLTMGQSPDSRYYSEDEVGMPFLQGCAEFGSRFPRHILFCSHGKKVAATGSILFSVRAPVGTLNVADREYIIGRGLAAITGTSLHQGYLEQYLRFEESRFRRASQGSTFEAINSSELSRWPIGHPTDPVEQATIAEVLSKVDEAIEQTNALINKQQRIKSGLMQDLLTRGLDEDGNRRTEETHEFKLSPIGRIPNDWGYAEIRNALELVLDFRGRTPKKLGMDWGGGDIPALSAKNVGMGKINLERETYYGSDALYKRWMARGDVSKGDVIMTTEAPLGNVAQIPDDRRYILSQRVILIRGRRGLLLNNFLHHYLTSDMFQAAMVIQSSGTTARGIQRREFERLHIPLPDIGEQDRISTIIDSIDCAVREERAAVQKLKRQKQGLLRDLLTGRRRVTALLSEPEMATE